MTVAVPTSVKDTKRVAKARKDAAARADVVFRHRKELIDRRNRTIRQLTDQGAPESIATAIADEETFEHVTAIWRAVAESQREAASQEALALSEYTARLAASSKEEAKAARTMLKERRRAIAKKQGEDLQAAIDARARIRSLAKSKPESVVPVDTPEASRLFGERIRPAVKDRINRLAEQAENVPCYNCTIDHGLGSTNGRFIADKLFELADGLEETTVFSEEALDGLFDTVRQVEAILDTITSGKKMRMTFEEWVKTRPPRGRKVSVKEEEGILKEWLGYKHDIDVPDLLKVEPGPTLRTRMKPDDVLQVTPDEFITAIGEAGEVTKRGRKVKDSLTVYEADKYAEMKLFLSPDRKSGAAVKPDGDLVSVFSVGKTGEVDALIERAVREGATKLDAYDEGELPLPPSTVGGVSKSTRGTHGTTCGCPKVGTSPFVGNPKSPTCV